ncbi:hypothetical protein ANTRET_LOCUS3456 [Anthophora retusa]
MKFRSVPAEAGRVFRSFRDTRKYCESNVGLILLIKSPSKVRRGLVENTISAPDFREIKLPTCNFIAGRYL